jgi:sensor histidine kinase YesM
MNAAYIRSTSRAWQSLARRFLIDFAIIVPIISTVCAAVITYVMHIGDSLLENWVFSACIGTASMILIDGSRLALWGERRPSRPAFFAVVVIAMPIAHFFGSLMAIKILGLSMQQVFNNQIEHASGLLIFITLVSLFISWYYWSRSQLSALKVQAEAEKARASAVEKQAMQAQLQLLQAQIEPHMLFNTLANLQGLIAIDPSRAQHMLDQLIHYLRATLSSSRIEKTTLVHEFELMQAYLELMEVRMGARLSFTLRLPPELANAAVPPMLLQPLVENAIKHGLESKIDGGHIDVQAAHKENMLVLSIADTGLGLDATAYAQYQMHGAQVGLVNLRERLHALYGKRATFTLYPNIPEGAIAQLIMPLSL